jgi:hypothetical protein
LHATGSAIVVHPDTARVLLRWHERMRKYLLATTRPAEATPESGSAEVRWFSLDDALVAVPQGNTRDTIRRVTQILQQGRGSLLPV